METYRGGSTNKGLRRLLRKYAEGGPFPEPALRDEDTYGPDTGQYRTDRAQATSDVVKAALAKSSAAMAARPMEPDLMGYQTRQAPEGYWYDDAGFMRNPQGQEVTPERRPSVIPFDKYGDFTNSKLLELAGNISGGILAPVRGAQGAFLLGSGPVLKAVEVAAQQVPRELSPLGFYSHGAETAANLAQAKGTPQQFRGMLEKYGVKPVEMEGFDEAFAGRPSVTREELAKHFKERRPQVEETVLGGRGKPEMDDAAKQKWIEDSAAERAYNSGDLDEIRDWRNASDDIRTWHLDAARYDFNEEMAVNPDFASQFQTIRKNGATKFQKYTLPGGENYREVLLKEPDTGDMNTPPKFMSSHWDDPNVLAHLRMADRTGPNGEKILHVEEIQSDWGQKGKKEGFDKPKVDLKPFEADRELARMASVRLAQNMIERESGGRFNSLSEVLDSGDVDLINRMRAAKKTDLELIAANEAFQAADRALQEARAGNRSSIPTAPYVTNTAAWTDLALKRALKEAAEGGYDRLVWTPGAEQAKRYDLSKQIHEIAHWRDGDQIGLSASGQSGNVLDQHYVSEKELSSVVGKELAEKIIKGEGNAESIAGYPSESGVKFISGEDLSIGGEGMKAYYDKIIPNQLSKQVKKLDPSVKVGITDVMLPQGKHGMMGHNNPPFAAPGLDITPKMREAIMKGQTDFARGGAVQGYATGGPTDNSLEALYRKYAEPTMRQRTRARYAEGGPVSSAAIYDPAEIDALAASIIEGNYA